MLLKTNRPPCTPNQINPHQNRRQVPAKWHRRPQNGIPKEIPLALPVSASIFKWRLFWSIRGVLGSKHNANGTCRGRPWLSHHFDLIAWWCAGPTDIQLRSSPLQFRTGRWSPTRGLSPLELALQPLVEARVRDRRSIRIWWRRRRRTGFQRQIFFTEILTQSNKWIRCFYWGVWEAL